MSNRIEAAMEQVPRERFLRAEDRGRADIDTPLGIGFGQTNSQPATVRMMLEWLDPQPGHKVLDVGSGSGWTTGLLAHLVSRQGYVHAVEVVPELVEFGRRNLASLPLDNVAFHQAVSEPGWPSDAPYDRVLVSAAAKAVPKALMNQLKVGGRMVVPVKNDILVIDKHSKTEFVANKHSGFAFVPLV